MGIAVCFILIHFSDRARQLYSPLVLTFSLPQGTGIHVGKSEPILYALEIIIIILCETILIEFLKGCHIVAKGGRVIAYLHMLIYLQTCTSKVAFNSIELEPEEGLASSQCKKVYVAQSYLLLFC